jgi:acyl-homoserine-lactone acylase
MKKMSIRKNSCKSVILLLALLASPALLAQGTGLAKHVIIRRDTYGVPHILGETEEAAAFAHGFVTAEDHIGVLARLLLRAKGEQAAQFGPEYSADDLRVQELGIYQLAHDRFSELPPLTQLILDAYADGYNFYLKQHADRAPEWAKPITGMDVLAHTRYVLLVEFGLNLRDRSNAVMEQKGSNVWALGRGRTGSGRGILLANPHLLWKDSSIFQEVHIRVPGRINVSGATLIGFPVVAIGFNEHLGWSHTVNQIRTDDVYELILDPKDHSRYQYEGSWLPLKAKRFSIRVKTSSGMEVRPSTRMWSHYGPVIRFEGDRAYSQKSANLDIVDAITEWQRMGKSKSLAEFRAALNMQSLPMFNVAYADREGNVLYLYNGRIPIRPAGYNWAGVMPGNTSESEWYGLHPVSELPQLLNPPNGYVQNCNDAPWYVNLHHFLEARKFPDYIGGSELQMRGQLSMQMLEASTEATLDQIIRNKFNEKLLLADRVKAELIAMARESKAGGTDLAEAASVLQDWDNRASTESRGAMLFVQWWDEYERNARPIFKTTWNAKAPLSTPSGIGDTRHALTALLLAARTLRDQYGSLEVRWGDVHRLRRGVVDVPLGGAASAYGAFRVISYRRDKDGKLVGVGGDSYVLAVEFTEMPIAYSIVAYSGSSDPQSPHFADQSEQFARGRLKRAWFSEEDIERHLERAYRPGE